MAVQKTHNKRARKAAHPADRPDPALAALVKYLAHWAADRDYEEHLENMSGSTRLPPAPQEPDS